MITDWSELHVKVYPLSRQLYEAMSRRDYLHAEVLAKQLTDIAFDIQRECIKQMVRSGEGFKPQYIYEGV